MKKIAVLALTLGVALFVFAQPGKTPVKTTAPKISPPMLKNLNDSASYAIGISVASFYKQQGIPKINTTVLAKAINDVFGNKETLLDDALANSLMNRYMNKLQEEKSRPNMIAG